MMTDTIASDTVQSPIGDLLLLANDAGSLLLLGFCEGQPRMRLERARLESAARIMAARDPGGLSSRVVAYFEGELSALDAVPVAPRGTPFQQLVWRALREIGASETKTYGEIARQLGRARAVRAVGAANGANPISLVVPCHRVIGQDGKMTGYAGGLERKRFLLEHERRHAVVLRAGQTHGAHGVLGLGE